MARHPQADFSGIAFSTAGGMAPKGDLGTILSTAARNTPLNFARTLFCVSIRVLETSPGEVGSCATYGTVEQKVSFR